MTPAPTLCPMSPAPPTNRPTPTLAERWLSFVLFAAALVLRILYAWHFRVDSDEPQHLHVVWAWTQGLLPYRDIFDNHTPVFQALAAPLFHVLGVRADILAPMRLAMIPIFALTIWCVWKCARTFCAPRPALWTAVLAAFLPPFFFTSIEFRPDELWTLAWLLTLTVLVTGRITTARLFAAGAVLGFSFCVSMKTSLLLAALAFALAGTLILRRRCEGLGVEWARMATGGTAALLGLLVVPALVVLFFVTHGAGPQMYYCVIQHNVLPDASGAGRIFRCTWHWLLWLLPIIAAGAGISRVRVPGEARMRIAFLFFAAAFYCITLISFWPILTAEDYLPFYPALMITAAPAVMWLAGLAGGGLRLPVWVLPLLAAAAEIACIVSTTSPFTDMTRDKTGIVADVLKLTDADDFVMDSKGETIYRNRPTPHVILEGLTLRRLRRGLLQDDIAERLIETRTPLATLRRMPVHAKAFIKANYVPIAYRLRALGQVLREDFADAATLRAFSIAVPGRYTLVCQSGIPAGIMDGKPFDGPRELAAGPHEFQPTGGGGRLVLIWAQAVERGYSPFTPIKEDVTTEQD